LLAGWEVHRGAIDELLQGMEELDQLDLAVDQLLQGMEELDQLDLAIDVEGVAAWDGGAAGDGGPQARLTAWA
jgi:hypothetical protein